MMNKFKKIGIDCRMSEETGIGRYIRNLVIEISKIDHHNSYILFVNSESSLLKEKLPQNFKTVVVNIKWHGWGEQILFLYEVLKQNLHLYHSPQSNMPYFYPKKFILTVHDLTIIKYKTGRASTKNFFIYSWKRLIFKLFLYFSILRACKVITVSNFVRDEILSIFPSFREKIVRIYNGVNLTVGKASVDEVKATLEKFKIDKPFFFYVGNAYPHKNLERLIKAFSLFNRENKFQLVFAGKRDFFYQRLSKEFSESRNLKFIGEVTDKELSALYSGCTLFTYPSISEGFGLQILEALNCGTNIVCSNNSSFPEIAGDLVYYFDPENLDSIIQSFEEAINKPKKISPTEVENIIKKFSWKDSAQQHLNLYEKS